MWHVTLESGGNVIGFIKRELSLRVCSFAVRPSERRRLLVICQCHTTLTHEPSTAIESKDKRLQ